MVLQLKMKKKRIKHKKKITHHSNKDLLDNKLKEHIGSLIVALAFLFLAYSLFNHRFYWMNGERLAVPIKGMMSISPSRYIKLYYSPDFELYDQVTVRLEFCEPLMTGCTACPNCSVEVYYNFGDGMELHDKGLPLNENGSVGIEIRSIPLWLFVTMEGEGKGFVRIPPANKREFIWEMITDKSSILNPITILFDILLCGITIIGSIIAFIKLIIHIYRRYKHKKDPPSYVG